MRLHRVFPGRVETELAASRVREKMESSRATGVWVHGSDLRAMDCLRSHLHGRALFIEIPADDVLNTRPDDLRQLTELWRSFSPATDSRRYVLSAPNFRELNQAIHVLRLPNVHGLVRPQTKKDLRISEEIPPADSEALANIPIFFEFLPWVESTPQRPTAREIYRFIQSCSSRGRSVRTYPGLEVWDDRIPDTFELEPSAQTLFSKEIRGSRPEISVVLPSYNNAPFLKSTLISILDQTLPAQTYEIILVDDGSTDGSRFEILETLAHWGRPVNFQYLFLPRPAARCTGDNQYRAGIARNVGVAHARAPVLQFLDSDMMARPGFLERVLREMQHWDVIQCQRHHFFKKQSWCLYDDVPKADLFIEDEKYWGPFFGTKDWMGLEHFWKYVCTYGLTLRREDFFAVGRFKRNFTTYGFEDVDLGYELFKSGKKFHLLHESLLHQTPPPSRSEYRHSPWVRHRLLTRTAQTFFRQHLDPAIYETLRLYMGSDVSVYWRRWWARRAAPSQGKGPTSFQGARMA